ncbi:chorismate mutase [Candidatus Saccharibacteria bacterium]|nr:chorismate mutase [Candidatus Saccharibacteria bacterium]
MREPKELADLRHEIDQIDTTLMDLLVKRQKAVKKVAVIKHKHKLPIKNLSRWKMVMQRQRQLAAKNKLSIRRIDTIWDTLHEMAIEAEIEELRK